MNQPHMWSGGIPPSVFQHPEDRAALERLQSVPLFPEVTRQVMELGYDRISHGMNMANKIRLSGRQLPHLYRILPPLCRKLAIPEPAFYLEMNPVPNAYAMGDAIPSITITSGLIECMDEDELKAVVAHECGHIACLHMKYLTMHHLIMKFAAYVLPDLAGLAVKPVQLALTYWSRRAEFSCDRAAAVALGSAQPVVEIMIRLAGGPKSITENINLEAYIQQADAYETLIFSDWDNTLQSVAIMHSAHPFFSVRVKQVLGWTQTAEFTRALQMVNRYEDNRANCTGCGHPHPQTGNFCGVCGRALEK